MTFSCLGQPNLFLGNCLVPGGPHTGVAPPCANGPFPEQPKVCGAYTIRFLNRQCDIIDTDSSNLKCCAIQPGSSFVIDSSGSKEADLTFLNDRFADLNFRDLVRIYLDNEQQPTWYGYISKKPAKIDGSDGVRIKAVGLAAQLKWGCVQEQFDASETVSEAVLVIAENYIQNITDIAVQDFLISPDATYPLTDMLFESSTIDQALSQLADLGGGFEYGVDNQGRFFFQPPPDAGSVNQDWYICKQFDNVKSTEDASNICNQIFVKHGQVSGGGSALLEVPLDDEASQEEFGIQCCTISAPSSLNPVDAYRYAAIQMQKLAQPIQRATVSGMVYQGEKPDLSGWVRIHGIDETLELPLKQIKYTFREGFFDLDPQLGQLESDLIQVLRQLNTQIARSELEERTNA